MRKRGICLLVAVLMVLQLLPQGLVAFANDPDVVSLNEDIVQNFDGATTESLEENGWHLAYTGGEGVAPANDRLEFVCKNGAAHSSLQILKDVSYSNILTMDLVKETTSGEAPWDGFFLYPRVTQDTTTAVNAPGAIQFWETGVGFYNGNGWGQAAAHFKIDLDPASFASGFLGKQRTISLYDNQKTNVQTLKVENDNGDMVPVMRVTYNEEGTSAKVENLSVFPAQVIYDGAIYRDTAPSAISTGTGFTLFDIGYGTIGEGNVSYAIDNIVISDATDKDDVIAWQDFTAGIAATDPDWVVGRADALNARVDTATGKLMMSDDTGHGLFTYRNILDPYTQPYEISYDIQTAETGPASEKWAYVMLRQTDTTGAWATNELGIMLGFRGNQFGIQGAQPGDWLTSMRTFTAPVNFGTNTHVTIKDYGNLIRIYAQTEGGPRVHLADLVMEAGGASYIETDDAAIAVLYADKQICYKGSGTDREIPRQGSFNFWIHAGVAPITYDNLVVKKLDALQTPTRSDYVQDFNNLTTENLAQEGFLVNNTPEAVKVSNGQLEINKVVTNPAGERPDLKYINIAGFYVNHPAPYSNEISMDITKPGTGGALWDSLMISIRREDASWPLSTPGGIWVGDNYVGFYDGKAWPSTAYPQVILDGENFTNGFNIQRRLYIHDDKEQDIVTVYVDNDDHVKTPVMRMTYLANNGVKIENLLTNTELTECVNTYRGDNNTPAPMLGGTGYYFFMHGICGMNVADEAAAMRIDNLQIRNMQGKDASAQEPVTAISEDFDHMSTDTLYENSTFRAHSTDGTNRASAIAGGKFQFVADGGAGHGALYVDRPITASNEFSADLKVNYPVGASNATAVYLGWRKPGTQNWPTDSSAYITVGPDYVAFYDGSSFADAAAYHEIALDDAAFTGGFAQERKIFIYDNKETNKITVSIHNNSGEKVPVMTIQYSGSGAEGVQNVVATDVLHHEVLYSGNVLNANTPGAIANGSRYFIFAHAINAAPVFAEFDNMLIDTQAAEPAIPDEPVDPNLIASQDFSENISDADPDWMLEAVGASVIENGKLHVLKDTVAPGHGGIGYKHSLTPYVQPYEVSYDLTSTMPDAANHKWAYLTMRQENPVTNASINANFVIGFRGNQMMVQGTPAGDWLSGATVYPLTGVDFAEETKVIVRDYGTIIKLYAQKSGGELIHIANFLMDENAQKYVGSDTPQVSLVFPRTCRTDGYFMIWAHNGASDNIYVDNLMLKKIDMLAPSEPSNPDKFSEDFSQTTNLYQNPAAYFRGEVTDGHEIFKVENGKAQAYKKTIDAAATPADENVHGAILIDTPLSAGTKNNEFSADVKVNYAANNDRALKAFIGWRKASFTTLPTIAPAFIAVNADGITCLDGTGFGAGAELKLTGSRFDGGFNQTRRIYIYDNLETNTITISVDDNSKVKVPVMTVTYTMEGNVQKALVKDVLSSPAKELYNGSVLQGNEAFTVADKGGYYIWCHGVNTMPADGDVFAEFDNLLVDATVTEPEIPDNPPVGDGFFEDFNSMTTAELGTGVWNITHDVAAWAVENQKLKLKKDSGAWMAGLLVEKDFDKTHEFSMKVKSAADPTDNNIANGLFVGYRKMNEAIPIRYSNLFVIHDNYIALQLGDSGFGDVAGYMIAYLDAAKFAGGFTAERTVYVYDNKEENYVIISVQADNGDRVPMFKVEYLNVDDIRITNFTTFEVKNSKNYVNQNIDGVETSVPEPNTQLGNKYYMLAHGIATSTAADFFTLDDMLVDLDATAPELPEPSDERLIAKEDFSGTLDKGKWFLEPGAVDPSGKGVFTLTTVGDSHSGIAYNAPLGTGSQPYSFAFDLQCAADGAGQYRTWITMRQGGIVNASLNENIALSLRNNKIGVQGTATGDWISSASEYELTGVNFSEMTRVIMEDYGVIIKVFAQKDGGEKIHILNLIMKPEGAKYAAGDAAQITLDWDTQVIYGAKAQNNKRPCLDSGYVYIWTHNGTAPAPVVDNIEIMKLDMPSLVGPQIKNLDATSSTEGFTEATADEAGKKLQLHYNSEKRMDAVNAAFTYDTSESAEAVVVFIDKNQNGVCDDGEAIESGVQTEVTLPAKLCFASQGITVTYEVTCVTNPLSDEQEKAIVQAIAGATAGTMEQALASVEEYLPEYGFFNDVYYKAIIAAGKQEMLYEQIIADRGGATTAAQIRDMILGAVGKTYVRSGLYQTEGMTAQQKVDAFIAVVSKLATSPYHLKIDLTKSMYNTLTVEDKANALTYLGLPDSKLNANGSMNDAMKAASYMAAANTRSDDINVKAKYVQEIFKDMPYFGANDFDNWPVGGEKQVYMKDLFAKTLGSNSYGDINDMMADMQAYEKKTNDHFKGNSNNNGGGGNPVTPSKPNSNKDKDVSVSIPSGITDAGGGNKGSDITLTDLDAIAWAKDAVSLLLQRGIVSGYPDNTFRGENFVSRAEFVKMIVMAFDLYDSSLTTKQFADVGTDAWYNSYVASAVKAGVVTGITPSVFGADQTIRKQDMMVMIYRALNAMKVDLTPIRDNPTFADLADVSEYAINAVNIGYQTGLINGDDQNRFNPRSESNRATAAMMIYNAIVQIEGGNAKS